MASNPYEFHAYCDRYCDQFPHGDCKCNAKTMWEVNHMRVRVDGVWEWRSFTFNADAQPPQDREPAHEPHEKVLRTMTGETLIVTGPK